MARPIAVIDAETDPFRHGRDIQSFIWGFYDGEVYLEFEEIDALIKYLRTRKIVVYAHNGGKFDYHFLLDHLEVYNEVTIINGRLAKFRIGECEFRDSINILPVALKHSGEKDENFDYSLMEPEARIKPENKEKISIYLRKDCEALFKLVTGFTEQYGRQLTQAGAAIKQWQKIAKRKAPRSDDDFYQRYKAFYYGGRVECFRKGVIETPFSVFDINSAYPCAMLEEHPFAIEAKIIQGKPREILPYNFYEISAVSKGALPFRNDRGKLLFPNDLEQRLYYISGHELIAALETNSLIINEWRRYHHFEETINFAEYIQKFWNLRQIAKADLDLIADLFAKLLMNSLYGKWAADPHKYKRYLLLHPEDGFSDGDSVETETGNYIISGQLGPWLLAERSLDDEEMRFYNVATGASITGFVRAYLWRAIHSCGINNMLYCDTDSIASIIRGEFIKEGKELGGWKNEGLFTRAGIGGKKLYVFDRDIHSPLSYDKKGNLLENKIASKGAKLTEKELWRIAKGEKVIYKADAPTYSVKKKVSYVVREIQMT